MQALLSGGGEANYKVYVDNCTYSIVLNTHNGITTGIGVYLKNVFDRNSQLIRLS